MMHIDTRRCRQAAPRYTLMYVNTYATEHLNTLDTPGYTWIHLDTHSCQVYACTNRIMQISECLDPNREAIVHAATMTEGEGGMGGMEGGRPAASA